MSAIETATRGRALLLAALIATCLAAAIALQVARDEWYPDVASPVDELYFTNGDTVGRMALSYKALLADVYWIRAVQYFGSTRLGANADQAAGRPRPAGSGQYDLLYPLLDVTTSLDPSFNIAYRFGSIFLAEGYPNGPGRPDLAVKLLDKGFGLNPTKWQYVYDKAFVYYWAVHDYRTAAHWFTEASRIPGSPDWMPGLAAFMLGEGGDRRASRFLWQQIRDTAEQDYMRATAEFRLTQLDMADAADRLSLLLAQYEARTGHRAQSFDELVRIGWLTRLPADPDGVPFVIDAATGRADLRRPSKYAPLPQEPSGQPAARP